MSYRYDFGDGTIVGPQPGSSAAHTYAAGYWNAIATVTDDAGASRSDSVQMIVAATPLQANLVGNPSFEQDLSGWGPFSQATLERVVGGFDGTYALQVTGTSSNASSFGVDENSDATIASPAPNTTYRFSAWVRSETSVGGMRIKVREYAASGKPVGGPKQSSAVTLSPVWQLVTLDFVTRNGGTSLDFQIYDSAVSSGEIFVVDNISVVDLNAPAGAVVSREEAGGTLAATENLDAGPLNPRMAPVPVGSHSTLRFYMAHPGRLDVEILDLAGRRVRRLVSTGSAPAGIYQPTVDGRGDRGERLSSGVYFYRIRTPSEVATGRFVIAY